MKKFTHLLVLIFATISISLSAQSQYALDFDGTDDFVNCGNDPSLNITGPVTVEAWIYLFNTVSAYTRFVEKDWATSYWLGSTYGTDGIAFSMDANGNANNVLETPTDILYQTIWTHIAGTWDGNTMKIYVNGEEQASMPWTNTVTGSTNNVLLGKYISNSNYFEGYMDEVRIWSEARTEQELRDNMYKELDNPAAEPALEAYYRFNEGNGQTSQDLSANSNTALLGGTLVAESSDPVWIAGNTPLPYKTKKDGIWHDVSTWKTNQGYPNNGWAIVEIDHTITVDTDEEAGYLTINPPGELTLTSGNALDVSQTFTIVSDATGTGSFIDEGIFSASTSNVQRYFAEDEWHLISSPISSGLAGIFTGMYLQSYDESAAGWTDVTSVSEPLNIMQGYALWIEPATTYTAEFSGTLNSDFYSRPFTADNPNGWNLMGNPYPSSVDWDMVVPVANMNAAVYYLDAASGNYVSYVSGVGASRYVPPMQGFWISATGSGTLSLNNSDRTHTGKDTYYKSENDNLAVIKASHGELSDDLYIRFNDEATPGFDGNVDAWKLMGEFNQELPQLYTYAGTDKLSIDTRPATTSVPAGITSLSNGTFTLSLAENNGFSALYVEDILTGEVTDLTLSDYSFSYNVNDADDRFVFHFETITGIEDSKTAVSYTVHSSNSNIYINTWEDNQAEAFVYNLSGQLVNQSSLTSGNNEIRIDNTGSYIVKVVGNAGVTASKIFIK